MFSEEKVKQAVWPCDGNKSVGLDGYSLEIFQRNWEDVKEDVDRFVLDFHDKARLT